MKLIQEKFTWYYHSDKLQITNGSLPIGPRTEYLISSNELFCAVFWSPVLVSKCPGLRAVEKRLGESGKDKRRDLSPPPLLLP